MEPEEVKGLSDDQLRLAAILAILVIVKNNDVYSMANPLYSEIEDELNRRIKP